MSVDEFVSEMMRSHYSSFFKFGSNFTDELKAQLLDTRGRVGSETGWRLSTAESFCALDPTVNSVADVLSASRNSVTKHGSARSKSLLMHVKLPAPAPPAPPPKVAE